MPETHKLYLDQMLRLEVAEILRTEGYNVMRASEVGQSRADDRQILQKAIAENRILVTLDKHFGDWVILPLERHPGVLRIHVHPAISENIVKILVPFLRHHSSEEFRNHLVILSSRHSKWIRTA